MEETFIIVIYYTLPKVTAPKKLWQDKNKVTTKEMCRRRDQAFLHTHSRKPVTDSEWVWFQIKTDLCSYESSKKIFCYRVVNQAIMSPVSLPLSHHRHISCSSLLLKSMYKKDYPPSTPIPQGILQKWNMQSVRGLYLKCLLPFYHCISSLGIG